MKKGILILILFISVLFTAFPQNSGPIDLILILDTSKEMSSSYEKVNDYITSGFLKEFLRIGDTFHLICFSSKQRIDLARRIQGRGDVETIIGRMLLQYPLESGKDYRGVLSYAQEYVSSLPQRAKKIVIVSSGGSQLDNAVNTVKQNFTSRNMTIDVVQVNAGQAISNLPKSNRPAPAQKTTAQQPSSSDNRTTGASQTQTQSSGVKTDTPQTVSTSKATESSSNAASKTTGVSDAAPRSGSSSDTAPKSGTSTDTAPKSGTSTDIAPKSGTGTEPPDTKNTASSNTAVSDKKGGTNETEASGSQKKETAKDKTDSDLSVDAVAEKTLAKQPRNENTGTVSIPVLAILLILALLVLILIVVFVTRRLRSSPNRVIAEESEYSRKKNKEEDAKFADHSKDLAKYAAAQSSRRTTPYSDKPVKKDEIKTEINPRGPLLLNLFVEDQNTAIGKRNIHSLKSGYSLTVGGGNSDFLIFLVPIPANIGELRRDEAKLTFTPKKPKYFPDIGSNEVKDCLNKTIRIISDRNYEMRFRFELWVDPLIEINRQMTSFRIPG